MPFNREGFITATRKEGYSIDIINEILREQGVDPIGTAARFVESPAIPAMGGILGGVFGAATPFTPVGGAMAGMGGGIALQDMLKSLLEPGLYEEREPEQKLGEAATAVPAAGLAAGGISSLLALLRPMRTLGGLRERSLRGRQTDVATLEEESLRGLAGSKEYMYGTPELQQMSKGRLSQFLRTTAPLQTTGTGAGMAVQQPQQIPLSKVYGGLTPFERTAGAYDKTSLVPQATRLASQAVRGYLTEEIPASTRLINQLYGSAAKLEPYKGKIAMGMGASIPIYLAGRMLYDLLRNVGGD